LFILLPDARWIEACGGNLVRFVIFHDGAASCVLPTPPLGRLPERRTPRGWEGATLPRRGGRAADRRWAARQAAELRRDTRISH